MATSYKQAVYSDFSGGYNDTSAAISIGDDEFTMSENADYSAEVKALQTRKGCTKQNPVSTTLQFEKANITDGYTWMIGSTQKECVVLNGTLYEVTGVHGEAVLTKKLDLPDKAQYIYPYVMYNTLYFSIGKGPYSSDIEHDPAIPYSPKMYQWGAFDYSSETMYDPLGNMLVLEGEIVRCDHISTVAPYSNGIIGHFYQAKADAPVGDMTSTTYWTDVTDVPGHCSNVVREIHPYNPSAKEIVTIQVLGSAAHAGTVTVTLYDENGAANTGSFTVAQGDSVADIVAAFPSVTGYDKHIKGDGWGAIYVPEIGDNMVLYIATSEHAADQAYVDPGDSGIVFSIVTKQEGKTNDNNLDDIKECTIFCTHSASHRVFAAGHPEDNAVWFSEIGYGDYWKSDLNKVYPAQNGMGRVTGMIEISEYLLVSYEHGWYAWKGTTPLEDANWKPINIPYGCIAPRSLVMTPNSFTFLAKEGIFCVSAAILNDAYVLMENKTIIRNLSDNKIEHTVDEINYDWVYDVADAVFYDNCYLLAVPELHRVDNTMVIKYDWAASSFTLITGWLVHRWMKSAYDLYFASHNFILRAFDGFKDINVWDEEGSDKAIDLHVKTKEYHFGTPFSMKNAQLIGLIFQQHDAVESYLKVIVHAGYRTYEINAVDLADSLYYNRLWGAAWGYREAIVKVIETIEPANTFQLEFIKSSIDDPMTLIGIGFIYENTDYVSPTVLKDELLLT